MIVKDLKGIVYPIEVVTHGKLMFTKSFDDYGIKAQKWYKISGNPPEIFPEGGTVLNNGEIRNDVWDCAIWDNEN